MAKPPDDADKDLFREAVADADRLDAERAEPYRRRPPPVPIVQPAYLAEETGPATLSESEIECGEFLLFSRPGVQKRLLADLQRGYVPVDLALDLHGLTVSHAQRCLDEFLTECARRRVRCACIIHGKGYRSEERQPVLKCKVNYWLRLRADVLAFCTASRRDGGTGAVYVLLRNPEKAGRERRSG